ncbi:MAG: hypothetical protein ACK4UT_01205 [Moraxellaceae bacterium]
MTTASPHATLASAPELGLHPKWKTATALRKECARTAATLTDPAAVPQQRWQSLTAYAEGGNPFADLIDPTLPRRGPLAPAVSDVLWGEPARLARWPLAMLDGAPQAQWLDDFAHEAAYAFWRWRIDSLRGAPGQVLLEMPARVLARCLYLGWMPEARSVALALRDTYAARRLANVAGATSQPLNHFLLRVAFDHWALAFDGWGQGHNPRQNPALDPKDVHQRGECFGEPVLNTLAARWRDPDLDACVSHLCWLADYTTHRLSPDREFAFGGQLAAYMPGVLLPALRLREQAGLALPALTHPLLAPPVAPLPAVQPMYTDPLLARVLARLAQEELPGLCAYA